MRLIWRLGAWRFQARLTTNSDHALFELRLIIGGYASVVGVYTSLEEALETSLVMVE